MIKRSGSEVICKLFKETDYIYPAGEKIEERYDNSLRMSKQLSYRRENWKQYVEIADK